MTERAPQGWYVDPDNPKRDVYWTGRIWSGANRPAMIDTPDFPAGGTARDSDGVSPARARTQRDEWTFRANVLYVLAGLAAIGAVIGAIVLVSLKSITCTGSGLLAACSDTHPFVAAGISVGLAGLRWRS